MQSGRTLLRLVILALCWLVVSVASPAADQGGAAARLPRIVTHQESESMGTLHEGVLTAALDITRGDWYPEAEDGPHVTVDAFAERSKRPTIPGPLIRVPQGTLIRLQLRNTLDAPRSVHGLNQRPGEDKPVLLGPGESRTVEFMAGDPGTYFYWGGAPEDRLEGQTGRLSPVTSQLTGALIVDDPHEATPGQIFVIGMWMQVTDRKDLRTLREFGVINGKSWPYNERAHYRLGETVHMRVINASGAIHPMHMHGSFFRVDATSDGQREKVVPPEQRPMVVTQVLTQGMAMEATWQPPNPGHWLLHCHLLAHVVSSNGPPYASLSAIEAAHAGHHASHGNMVGVTMGIDVDGGTQFRPVSYRRARKLTLTLRQAPTNPEHVFTEVRERRDRAESSGLMGPPIVLRRGEPVEIAVQNRMREETAIHWHGMELESYYDGVPDFSGAGRQVTPPIQPGGKFMVRFTPPRAGTFIYHTHWHDVGQLSGGLYGPLLVVEPDKPYDRESDIAVVAGGDNSNLLINGSPQGSSMHWQAGRRYHLRFINIMVNTPVVFSLQSAAGPVHWTAVGKDGMVLPAAQRVVSESKVRIFTGETYDFEITPGPGDMVLRAFRAPLPPGLVVERKIDIPIQVGPAVLRSESAGTRPAIAEVTSAKDKR